MKKIYEAPTAEKMEFNYRDQVVVASNKSCVETIQHTGPMGSLDCENPEAIRNFFQ